ncbi:MAG: ATP-binding protein [Haloechinothrix sp.]
MATKIEALAQALAAANPWWRDTRWAQTDPDLVEVSRSGIDYRPCCLHQLARGGLYILRGPRRVGKTVETKRTVGDLIAGGVDPRRIVRMAVDGWRAEELRTLVSRTRLPRIPDGESRYWFLDEVTGVPDGWASAIKWLRDNDAAFRAATVVLTGSNARGLAEAVGVLAGRRGATGVNRSVLPMGFRSFAHVLVPELAGSGICRLAAAKLRSPELADACEELLVWLDVLVDTWESYLHYGGYPQSATAARAGREVPSDLLDTLFDVVFRDAFNDSGLSELDTHALLGRIAKGLSSPNNASSVAADCDLTVDTVKRRLNDLINNYLLWPCHQVDADLQPRRRAQSKLYFTDPLLARLAHARNSAWDTPDLTALVEQQMGLALVRGLEADDPGRLHEYDQVAFHRTDTGSEIDFVGANLAGAAVEGKYTEGGKWAGAARTVNASTWAGVLATRNVLDTSAASGRAWAVPAAMLAYLIDT